MENKKNIENNKIPAEKTEGKTLYNEEVFGKMFEEHTEKIRQKNKEITHYVFPERTAQSRFI